MAPRLCYQRRPRRDSRLLVNGCDGWKGYRKGQSGIRWWLGWFSSYILKLWNIVTTSKSVTPQSATFNSFGSLIPWLTPRYLSESLLLSIMAAVMSATCSSERKFAPFLSMTLSPLMVAGINVSLWDGRPLQKRKSFVLRAWLLTILISFTVLGSPLVK